MTRPPKVLRVIDYETTGLPPDAEVIEVGWTDVYLHGDGLLVIDPRTHNYRTALSGKYEINVEAMATHHIMTRDLEDAPALEEIMALMLQPSDGLPIDVLVAHNAKFEKQFTQTSLPWICTMKCAYQAFPDSPRHTNQVLRYYLDTVLDRARADPPHAAGPDTYVTAHILMKLFEVGMTIERMVEISAKPSLLPKVMFGKHKGDTWDKVPTSYLTWIRNQSEMDEDVRYTATYYLRKAYGHQA